MKGRFGGRVTRLVVLCGVGLTLAAGIAYATIPDGGGVYTACMLKSLGTIRIIDPSLPASNTLGHCTSVETQISWNRDGQQGTPGTAGKDGAPGRSTGKNPAAPGTPGKDGAPGKDGQSVTEADAGSHCPSGGTALTAANGTSYVCNGSAGGNGGPPAAYRFFTGVPFQGGGHDFDLALPDGTYEVTFTINVLNSGADSTPNSGSQELHCFANAAPGDPGTVVVLDPGGSATLTGTGIVADRSGGARGELLRRLRQQDGPVSVGRGGRGRRRPPAVANPRTGVAAPVREPSHPSPPYLKRRGWDSNPGDALTPNDFQGRPVRPLRHPAARSLLTDQGSPASA